MINSGILGKLTMFLLASTLSAGLLAGCANNSPVVNEEQQANRAYMSQANEIMDQLGIGLDSFVDAVSRGDIVNMRSQADNAYQSLDKLSSLEAPEQLSDVQSNYLDGTGKLREALDAYIQLYTEVSSASFDWSTYESRISAIQGLYDEGVAALQKGDETAASKE